MTIMFEVKGKEAIEDMKEFCRLKSDELTYIGQFANKETSEVIQGSIIKYNGKYYTTETPLHAGVSFLPVDKEGMITTCVELFETDYVPERCKPLRDCSIRIDIWNVDIDKEIPIGSYAFYDSQLEAAKEVVKGNKDVDIFIDGIQIARKDFLER